MTKSKKVKYVWVCELCLRVVSDKFGEPAGFHKRTKGGREYCTGNWIRKPISWSV